MSPVDIFTLQKRDARSTSKLMAREGYGETSVRNLFAAIDARRRIELHRLIFALGIRHVGEGNAKLLARHYGTVENFREAMLSRRQGTARGRQQYARPIRTSTISAASAISSPMRWWSSSPNRAMSRRSTNCCARSR